MLETRRRTTGATVAAALLATAACSGGGTEPGGDRVASIAVTPPAPSVPVGSTLQLSATAVDGSGAPLDGARLVWASADSSVASVAPDGVVTARKLGAVQIQAVTEGQSAYSFVTVVPRPIAAVTVAPATATVAAGAALQLQAAITDDRGGAVAGATVVWRSTNEAVARVTSTGLVSGVAPGPATITATAGDGKSASASVTVTGSVATGGGARGAVVARVVVQPGPAASVFVGDQLQLTATAFDTAGSVIAGRAVAWASGNQAAATVDGATGRARGVAPGTATISATVDGVSASTVLTVARKPVATLDITAPPELTVGQQAQLAATPRDADRQPLAGRTVVWASSNEAVVAVGRTTGVADARGAGSVVITASVEGEGVSNSTTLLVQSPVPPPGSRGPVADFAVGCTNLVCAFTDASTAAGGSLVTWRWEFGDGVTSPFRNSDNVYQAGGSYTVKLTITDDRGATASVTKTVAPATGAPAVQLVNRATGRCLSVAPSGAVDPRGAPVVTRPCDGAPDQRFSLPTGSGAGPLQLARYANRYVELPEGDASVAQGWQWNGSQHQRWSRPSTGELRNYLSNVCLVDRGAGAPAAGEGCDASDRQRWDARP